MVKERIESKLERRKGIKEGGKGRKDGNEGKGKGEKVVAGWRSPNEKTPSDNDAESQEKRRSPNKPNPSISSTI
jgi:hypothetical protein